MNRKTRLALLALAVLVVVTPGCGVVNSLRAKDTINEGVRMFNQGRYEDAEKRFARALELSPESTNAQLFYARALNARFEQSLTEDLGLKTLQAYDEIIKNNKTDPQAVDRALAFKSKAYEMLMNAVPDKAAEYREKRREVLLQRAESSTDPKTKADVYYTIGHSYWDESYRMNSAYISKNQPIPPDIQEKMKPLIRNAHEYLRKAIAVQSDYANAYFYEKLVFIEEAKVNPADRAKLQKQVDEMQEMYNKIQAQSQQQASQG